MMVGHMSKCLEVPEIVLPWLVEFSGPAVMAPAVLVPGTGAGVSSRTSTSNGEASGDGGSNPPLELGLKVLEIHGPVPLATFLEIIEKSAARDVERLTVLLQQWDAEALFAVSQLLPNLKDLTIVYASGGPSDGFLVSIGPELLPRLSSLQNLELLAEFPDSCSAQPGKGMVTCPGYVRDLLASWQRFSLELITVSLARGSLWEKVVVNVPMKVGGRMEPQKRVVVRWEHYLGGDDDIAGLRVQAIGCEPS